MVNRESFEKWYQETYKIDEDARFKPRTSRVDQLALEAWVAALNSKDGTVQGTTLFI